MGQIAICVVVFGILFIYIGAQIYCVCCCSPERSSDATTRLLNT